MMRCFLLLAVLCLGGSFCRADDVMVASSGSSAVDAVLRAGRDFGDERAWEKRRDRRDDRASRRRERERREEREHRERRRSHRGR